MKTTNIIREIETLKKEKKAIIVAHNYQLPQIQDIADFVGDSLELSKKAAELKGFDIIVFCGVSFMAETAKILSPDKKVLLPEIDAGCPMADMVRAQDVLDLKEKYPNAWVVSYVNTNADVKALSDVCCTSANADIVVKNTPVSQVVFLPDRNLCWYVKTRVPEKDIICYDGYCYVHRKFTPEDVINSRKLHPNSELIVHPECDPEVQKLADGIYSTSGILQRAKESAASVFIIGTEEGLIHRIKKENPTKQFYSLGNPHSCYNMKKTSLISVRDALLEEKYNIEIPEEVSQKAKKALIRMIEYI
jgi:quinolinate synthase